MKFSRSRVQDLASEKAWPSLPPMGETKPIAHCPTAWLKPPASVVAAKANPAPPKTAVMTKAKAAPKIGSRRNSKGSGKKCSPKLRTTAAAAADLDPLPEPQQPAQAVPVPKEESDAGEVTSQKSDEKKEDKHEKKEDKHEKKENKHEEKTESNHQETHYGRGDVDESASSAAVEPTPVPEIAQAAEAPQALCLCVGMYHWPTKDHQTLMPNVYLRVGSFEDVTTTQLLQVFGSSSRSIVKYCECNLHK